MKSTSIKKSIEEIVNLLSRKAYAEIIERDYKKLLDATDLENSIVDYGGEITIPLEKDDFNDYDFYFKNDEDNVVIVEYDLFVDSKKSDLTLVYYFRDGNNNSYSYSIYGIYVK